MCMSVRSNTVAADSIVCCATDDDTTHRFKPVQLVAPGILLTLGTLGAIEPKITFNQRIDDAFASHNRTHVDDYLRIVPSAAHLTLGFIPSLSSRHNFRDRLLMSVTSHAAMMAMTYSLKFAVNEKRPDMSDNQSFPSGHVAWAFTGAELVRYEYGNAYGLGAYAVAGVVAFMRIHQHHHWMNDIVMGAGIGILSANIGRWLLPLEKRLLKLDGCNKSPVIVAIPGFDPVHRTMSVSVVSVF